MATVVRFAEGVMVQVAPSQTPAEPVIGKSIERLPTAFQSAVEVVGASLRSVVGSVQQAIRDTKTSSVEVEFGIGFSLEGNVYITKATAEGNLTVKVTIDATKI